MNKKNVIKAGIIILISGISGVIGYSYFVNQLACDYINNEARLSPKLKGELLNLTLACKAYWADVGSEKTCTLDIAKSQNYGFIYSKDLSDCFSYNYSNLKASGSENTFKASVWVERRGEVKKTWLGYEINSKEEIRELTEPPS